MNYPDIALHVPQILLPGADVVLGRWAVIACDQYTSQPEYWDQVRQRVEDQPSALNLVFPEAHLDRPDRGDRIAGIDREMRSYLDRSLLDQLPPGFVLVDRQTPMTASRKGLMVALDLERYDYGSESRSLIRPTEDTVVSRLPPRIEIRRQASLELPHIMVLIDDPGRTVIDPLFEFTAQPLYDIELMQGGGRVRGWFLTEAAQQDRVAKSLRRLLPADSSGAMLYALGDGNHSFAAAKEVWEEVKRAAPDRETALEHPARHVLVELVNLHDEGMALSPIHRLVNGVDGEQLLELLVEYAGSRGERLDIDWSPGSGARRSAHTAREHELPFVTRRGRGVLRLSSTVPLLQVVALAGLVDDYCSQFELSIDYIHGDRVLEEQAYKPGSIGFLATAIDKKDLFPTIMRDGPLPCKAFSMGEAEEKRYYLEARRIR